MGLFTNRRKQEDTRPIDLLANGAEIDDWVDPAEALGLNGDLWDLAPPPPAPATDAALFPDAPLPDAPLPDAPLPAAPIADAPAAEDQFVPGLPPTTSLFDSPRRRRAGDASAPVAPRASTQLEEMGISLADQQPTVPPPPRRMRRSMLESNEPLPAERRLAGNLDFDERGLLEMLGLPLDSDLRQVSAATTAFLADLDPDSETDPEAAELKRRIRCEVNTAYATYRLVMGR